MFLTQIHVHQTIQFLFIPTKDITMYYCLYVVYKLHKGVNNTNLIAYAWRNIVNGKWPFCWFYNNLQYNLITKIEHFYRWAMKVHTILHSMSLDMIIIPQLGINMLFDFNFIEFWHSWIYTSSIVSLIKGKYSTCFGALKNM